jgi:molybdopterin-guanine dinucleotide biosynthesis protein A
MSRDKAELPFGDETLLTRTVRIVSTVVEDVVVVARKDQLVPALLRHPINGSPPIVVRDPVDDQGPLVGIVTGLHSSRDAFVFVTACDMPLLKAAVITRLFDLIGDADVCVPVDGEHVMTLCAVYRRDILPYAEALVAAGQRSVRVLIDRVNAKRVDAAEFRDIDPELDSFFSCDTPERYQEALGRLPSRK